MADKVKFSVRNVHYAVITRDESGKVTFAAPVAIPGAVALSLEPQGEVTKFWADGICYFMTNSNNGYTGDLEVAYFPESFLKDVMGYTLGATSKVLTENANVQPKEFALLFEEEGDATGTKFVMYNCASTRPTRQLKTKEETKTPTTQKISITSTPLADGRVIAMSGADTPAETLAGWYTKVFEEAAS